jgi:hypothetical protein
VEPDRLLEEALELARAVLDDDDADRIARELALKITNLDFWLSSGGFLPRKWWLR